MRSQDILDMYDYYDFHTGKNNFFEKLYSDILSGNYRPRPPLHIRAEKSKGIFRRIAIPCAEDALILQVIVDYITPALIKAAPSENSFYSRSHVSPLMGKTGIAADYVWFHRWLEFSGRRINLSNSFKYIVITDISNFFDSIDLRRLRSIISSISIFSEVILDFMFLILESFVWKPDYSLVPLSGLPQVNFDAPRLLAHVYLYEIDKFLLEATGGNYLRWVDDISFGANSEEEAREILGRLDEIMAARGLRLNMGKTKVLLASEAHKYFFVEENKFIDMLPDKKFHGYSLWGKDIFAFNYDQFKQENGPDYKDQADKILKRYLKIFSSMEDCYMEEDCEYLLGHFPSLRSNIFSYFLKIGVSETRFEIIYNFLSENKLLDETSIFGACKLICDWDFSNHQNLREKIMQLVYKISSKEYVEKTQIFFLGSLWIATKYADKNELSKHLENNINLWSDSEFISKQIAATLPILNGNDKIIKLIKRYMSRHGQRDFFSVMENIETIDEKSFQIYVTQIPKNIWSISRFIIARAAMNSNKVTAPRKNNILKFVENKVGDFFYKNKF